MKSPLNLGLAVCATVALAILPASAQKNPLREAYFGETHVHTSWSFDAYVFGNIKTGPEEAYKYAMGEPIEHPAGYQIKITRPLGESSALMLAALFLLAGTESVVRAGEEEKLVQSPVSHDDRTLANHRYLRKGSRLNGLLPDRVVF